MVVLFTSVCVFCFFNFATNAVFALKMIFSIKSSDVNRPNIFSMFVSGFGLQLYLCSNGFHNVMTEVHSRKAFISILVLYHFVIRHVLVFLQSTTESI